MYPTVGHLLSDILGRDILLPLPTFGTLVILAVLVAVLYVRYALRLAYRAGWLPDREISIRVPEKISWIDVFFSAGVGFLIFWKGGLIFSHPEAFLMAPDRVIFSGKGHIPAGILGALLFGGYAWFRQWKWIQKEGGKEVRLLLTPPDQLLDLAVWTLIPAIILAKVFHVLEYPEMFREYGWKFVFSTGGFTFYGAFVGGFLGVLVYIKNQKWKGTVVADIFGPALALGYGVGRIGCHLAGDGDWGIPNPHPKPAWLSWLPDFLWAETYPHNVINEGVLIPGCEGIYCYELPEPVYPTPLYETFMSLLIFGILWWIWRKVVLPRPALHGMVFALYLFLGGIERYLIEQIRVNPEVITIGGISMTQAEFISLVLTGIGVIWCGFLLVRYLRR